MALLGFGGRSASDPHRAMRAFFVGEAAKIAVVIVLFVAVLKTMKVVPLAMLGTYVATFFVFWVALANALPPAGRRRRRARGRGQVVELEAMERAHKNVKWQQNSPPPRTNTFFTT